MAGDGSGVVSHESCVTKKDESCDIHVTAVRGGREGGDPGSEVVREQFYTTDTVQVTVFFHMWPRKEGIDS